MGHPRSFGFARKRSARFFAFGKLNWVTPLGCRRQTVGAPSAPRDKAHCAYRISAQSCNAPFGVLSVKQIRSPGSRRSNCLGAERATSSAVPHVVASDGTQLLGKAADSVFGGGALVLGVEANYTHTSLNTATATPSSFQVARAFNPPAGNVTSV